MTSSRNAAAVGSAFPTDSTISAAASVSPASAISRARYPVWRSLAWSRGSVQACVATAPASRPRPALQSAVLYGSNGVATPISYELDGKQYVAVMSGVQRGRMYGFALDAKQTMP